MNLRDQLAGMPPAEGSSPRARTAILALGLGLLLCQSATSACDPPARAAPPARGALHRGDLPPAVRSVLRHRMANHARTMNELLGAVLVLDHPRIAALSAQVIAEPRIARPPAGDGHETDLINRYLPARFFTLQDQLVRNAGALRQAARARDDNAVAQEYGRLATTCVQCHAVYLRAPSKPAGAAGAPPPPPSVSGRR